VRLCYLQDWRSWPISTSFPLHREMKVLLPVPVIPMTRMKIEFDAGGSAPANARKFWTCSTNRVAELETIFNLMIILSDIEEMSWMRIPL
jgi:hypothetical protein